MSATELSPKGADAKLVPLQSAEGSKKGRMASMARASTDFYGAIGWVLGLLITLFISAPADLVCHHKHLCARTVKALLGIGTGDCLVAKPTFAGYAGIYSQQRPGPGVCGPYSG